MLNLLKHYTGILHVFIFLIQVNIAGSQPDPRQHNHGVCIVPFQQTSLQKYYITWSSSHGEAWEHDIFSEIVTFQNGKIQRGNGPRRYIGSDEAQEPVNAAISAESIILSAFEDGSGRTVDVRGQLHYSAGEIVRSNWIIAGGSASQHSVAVCYLGKLFCVAYADEAPPAEFAIVKARTLAASDGTLLREFDLTSPQDDNWWPVTASNNQNLGFVGWGDGETFSGAVCRIAGDTLSWTPRQEYLFHISHYYYQVIWLDQLRRFLAIAKSGSRSSICLIDSSGRRTAWQSVPAPIIREARMAARWDSLAAAYKIAYPTGTRDLAVLKITSAEIQLSRVIAGDQHPQLNRIKWPSTGMWGIFVTDEDGQETWDAENILLLAMNSETGNNIVLLPVRLPSGFATSVSPTIEQLPEPPNSFQVWPAYPNPFTAADSETYVRVHLSRPGEVSCTIFNLKGQSVREFPLHIVQPGIFQFNWNGRNAQGNFTNSGIYFISVKFGNQAINHKILLLK